jgi:hypothetical protein
MHEGGSTPDLIRQTLVILQNFEFGYLGLTLIFALLLKER